MSNLMRQSRGNLDAAHSRSRRVPRHVVDRVDREAYEGLVASARIQSAAYVTHTALTSVALLSGEEARLIQQCPLAEPRLRVLVNHFAGLCAYELATFGR